MGTWLSELHSHATPLTVGLGALLLTLMLARYAPTVRPTAVNTLLLLGISYTLQQTFTPAMAQSTAWLSLIDTLLGLLIGFALIHLVVLGIFRLLLPRLRCQLPKIVEDLTLAVLYLGWLFSELRQAGLDPSSLVATSAVITAVLAFALQDTLGNILGGIALQLDHSFAIGDWVELDQVNGRVVEIHWRYTAVETRNWETVIIPNSLLMKNRFTVLGRRQGEPPRWRRTILFNVAYSHPPARVIALVETAICAAQIPQVAAYPPPIAVMLEFRSGYGRFALRYWLLDFAQDDPTDSQVRNHIYTVLQRAGISPAIEQQAVELLAETGTLTRAALNQEPMKRLAAIAQIDLFRELTPGEQESLAQRLVYSPFMPGEVITRQGAIANWLYILTSGEAEVILESSGTRTLVNTLGAGDFFGEMALLTGAPRSATVLAKTMLECFRLDKDSFEAILRARPSLAETLAVTLATRRQALRSAQENIEAGAQAARATAHSRELLATIQRFFGLK
jgi:small-conductance mechanosensitive channel/CRP-like cAMP-binding protein